MKNPALVATLHRPAVVTVAVCLLVIAFLVSGLGTPLRFVLAHGLTNGQLIIFVMSFPFGVALAVWIARAVWKGRNWARVILTLLLCLKLAAGYWVWPLMHRVMLVDNLIYLVTFVLLGISVALQYTSAARAWFLGGRTLGYRRRDRLTATSGLGE